MIWFVLIASYLMAGIGGAQMGNWHMKRLGHPPCSHCAIATILMGPIGFLGVVFWIEATS